MSSMASKNAFRGYSFQYQVFTLLLIKMDYDRKILKLKAENFVDHNFDDIFIDIKDNPIYVQVKNMSVTKENYNINDNYIKLNNQEIKYNPNITNLLIVNDINIEINSELLGLQCFYKNSIYICSLNTDAMYDYIESLNIDEKRLLQLMRLSSAICSDNCEINITDLPKFHFYNVELKEKTIQIRKELMDYKNNYVNFIIGKPGIGKSHFVNELNIKDSILYRFWIGENDIDKNERLLYKNFIRDISYHIFDCSHIKEEDEIIKKLVEDKKILIIDGLDHVENYNPCEIKQYFSFIEMLEKNKIRSIVLSRPLKYKINGHIVDLSNWNKSQTKEFINKKFGILNYTLEEQIYNISNGYPIIVDFLCKEYLLNGKIRPFSEIDDLNSYYDALIHNNDIFCLYVFSKCRCFLIEDELKDLLGNYSWSLFQEFLQRNKFLFSIDLDRISLIHDSLNLYIRTKLPKLKEFDDKLQSYVSKSLLNNEIRFFARFQSFCLDRKLKLKIIKNYLNLNTFKVILYNNLDYESIRNFYKILPNEMNKFTPNHFTELEYLQLAIIESIVSRNHIEQNFDILIPLFKYIKSKTIKNYNTSIYSSETLYWLQNFNIKGYQTYIDAGFYDANQVIYNYKKSNDNFELFLKRKNIKQIDTSKLCFDTSQIGDFWRIEELSGLLCQLFLTKNNFMQAVDFVTYCATDNPNYYPIAVKILDSVKLNNQFNIRRLKENVKHSIFEFDEFKEINYYDKKTLKEIIIENAHEGSFTLNSYICSCLRHAVLCNKSIDIESISLYFGMFYQRKDYSLDDIQTFLKILKEKGYIDLQKCFNLINTCQNMTEKSYRHNFTDFLNNITDDELDTFIKNNNVNNYRIIISYLNSTIINKLPYRFVYREINDIIIGNPYRKNTSISYNDVDKILKSKYSDIAIEMIKQNNITVSNCPKDFIIKDINIIYDKNEYVIGSQFEDGYAYYKDAEFIKEKNINHLNLARMIDCYLFRLPYANLFYHFEENIIKKDIKKILFNALCLSNYRYFDFYLYNMSISSMIELFEHFNINVSWDKINEILNTFLEISLVF